MFLSLIPAKYKKFVNVNNHYGTYFEIEPLNRQFVPYTKDTVKTLIFDFVTNLERMFGKYRFSQITGKPAKAGGRRI